MDSQALIGREDKTTRIPAVHQSSQMTSHEQEAGVMQTTAILPEQSLSFVQIFLHGAIASVLYTRGLLRHDHPVFSDRCVADLLGADGPVTYKEFLHLNTQAGQMKSQAFKILVKGQSVRANTVLSLLEDGIFIALQNGYLEAVQLTICADNTRPSEVVECYTFAFTYSSSSGQAGRTVSSITVSPGHQTVFLVGDAQKSFNAAIKSLLKLIRGLPQLTSRRNLALHLFYTDGCPASYEPQGFSSCVDEDISFPGGSELVRQSQETASLVTGAYRVGVVVSHIDSADGEEQMQVIPEDMQYSNKRSRLDEYKTTAIEVQAPSADPPVQPFAQLVPLLSRPPPYSDVMVVPAAPSTQTREDIRTREALQQMQQSSSKDSNLVPTQTLFDDDDDVRSEDSNPPDQSYANALVNATQILDGQERMIVPFKMAELIIHVRALQNRCPAGSRVFDDIALKRYKIKRNAPSNMIKCECKDQTDDGKIMLCCEICGTWQHLSCYGWDAVEERNRPVDHVCYSCLLLPEEKELNNWMPTLVACRNALRYLYDNGFDSKNDDEGLIKAMRFKGKPDDLMNSEAMQTLIKEGLVRVGKDGRTIVAANRERGLVEYLDPMASIFHLYALRDDYQTALPAQYKGSVETLMVAYKGFALDTITTRNSFGEDVVRYGWYPKLAAIQSRRKRPASSMEDKGAAGAGGEAKKRKLSKAEMVRFDEMSSDAPVEEEVMETEDEGDDGDYDDDLYN